MTAFNGIPQYTVGDLCLLDDLLRVYITRITQDEENNENLFQIQHVIGNEVENDVTSYRLKVISTSFLRACVSPPAPFKSKSEK